MLVGWLVAWHSGRMSVFDKLLLSCARPLDLQLTGDHLCR